jgi:hypothetical protein
MGKAAGMHVAAAEWKQGGMATFEAGAAVAVVAQVLALSFLVARAICAVQNGFYGVDVSR